MAFCSTCAHAERKTDEATIQIQGEARRYYHLHDQNTPSGGPVILLIDGSGCGDFGARLAGFFELYPAPADVYFLEKPHIEKGVGPQPKSCSPAFERDDYLERRVSDALEFIESEPRLKQHGERSIAVVGFSEGGRVAPIVASRSKKIGWLATVGSGGMPQADGFLTFARRGVAPYANPYSEKLLQEEFATIAKDPKNLDKHFFGHSYHYWNSHLFYDPITTYSKLDIPIVAAMGEKDEAEPIESGFMLKHYFEQHPDRDFQFIEYRNASHGLQVGDKSNIKSFIANLDKWFKGAPHAFDHDE